MNGQIFIELNFFLIAFSGNAKMAACICVILLVGTSAYGYLSWIKKREYGSQITEKQTKEQIDIPNEHRIKPVKASSQKGNIEEELQKKHVSTPIFDPSLNHFQTSHADSTPSEPFQPAPSGNELFNDIPDIQRTQKETAKIETEEKHTLLLRELEDTKQQLTLLQDEIALKKLEVDNGHGKAQDKIRSLEKSIKAIFTSYTSLLKKYEEMNKAHLFEIKTILKTPLTTQSKEVSALLTFHRNLTSVHEQIYFLSSLLSKDEEDKGGQILQSLSALQSRTRLKTLDLYSEIPWVLLNIATWTSEGISKSCRNLGISEHELNNSLSVESLKNAFEASEQELFEISIGEFDFAGIRLNGSGSHVLLVCQKAKLPERLG